MQKFYLRLLKLIVGLYLYAIGIITTIHANIGYAPWDVFHVGLAKTTGLSLGQVSILTGFIIVLVTILLGETLGIGTILNMILIGLFIDWIIQLQLIPLAPNFMVGVLMLLLGLLIISFATYFYISPGFGTGPRDGLMVALSRKLKLSVGVCRGSIELTVTLIGYFLGGKVGAGTVIYVILVGFVIQGTFHLLHFDPKGVRHEKIQDTLARLRNH